MTLIQTQVVHGYLDQGWIDLGSEKSGGPVKLVKDVRVIYIYASGEIKMEGN